jgi:hypothetical protein
MVLGVKVTYFNRFTIDDSPWEICDVRRGERSLEYSYRWPCRSSIPTSG